MKRWSVASHVSAIKTFKSAMEIVIFAIVDSQLQGSHLRYVKLYYGKGLAMRIASTWNFEW
jgi:glutamine phosphoribosylpyrophosphate amidotransferase